MATKEITFPKRQNVTFYEKDKELYFQIAELAKKDGRPIQNYILQLLHQVIPTRLDSTGIETPVGKPINENYHNTDQTDNNVPDVPEETRNFLVGLAKKA